MGSRGGFWQRRLSWQVAIRVISDGEVIMRPTYVSVVCKDCCRERLDIARFGV